jgi:hypothetical protein
LSTSPGPKKQGIAPATSSAGISTERNTLAERTQRASRKKRETVNHPKHYNTNPSGIECIDVIEHLNFNIGSAIKYLWRVDDKDDPIDDLRKAEWYIKREIERRRFEIERRKKTKR